jgi:hypothetical protein
VPNFSFARAPARQGIRTKEARELLGPALVGFTIGPELPDVAEAERLLALVQGRRVGTVT